MESQSQVINLKELQAGQAVTGLVLIKEYTKKTDHTSKAPLKGVLHYKGRDLEFGIWTNNPVFNTFQDNELKGRIFLVQGNVNEYMGKLSIMFDAVNFNNQYTNYDAFYKALDVTSLHEELTGVIQTLGIGFQKALQHAFSQPDVYDLYKKTWAGAKMHDAYMGGLFHHTMKMVRLALTLIQNDSRLDHFRDVMLTGIIVHDIGKIYEIAQDGTYTKHSYVTHRTIGVEMIAQHKQVYVDLIGVDAYYQLLAIIQGHHGEYGDKPTTILTYIIHLIDMLEATTTGILDKIENKEVKEKNGNDTVWVGYDYPNLVV